MSPPPPGSAPGSPPLPPGFLARPVAHRGLHDRAAGRPENSRAAVRAAVAAGYAVEIDLHLSADGVAMVFHDDALDRLTEATGPLRARAAAALARIRLRDTDEGIPTFAEVLARVAGRVPLVVELKDRSGDLGPSDGALEAAAAAEVAGYAGPLAFMSFNPAMVARVAAVAPDRPRGLVTCGFAAAHWPHVPAPRRAALARIEAVETVGAAFVSHQWRDLAAPRIAALRAAGLPILCWTIRSAQEAAQARAVADAITFEGFLPDARAP